MSAYKLIIDGKKVATTETFPVINPATEEVAAQCPKATVEHVNLAVPPARRAFPAWSATPDAEPSRLIHAIAVEGCKFSRNAWNRQALTTRCEDDDAGKNSFSTGGIAVQFSTPAEAGFRT